MSAKAPFTRLTKNVRNLNPFQSFAGKNSTQAGEIFIFKVQPLYFLLHLFPVLSSFQGYLLLCNSVWSYFPRKFQFEIVSNVKNKLLSSDM